MVNTVEGSVEGEGGGAVRDLLVLPGLRADLVKLSLV